MARIEGLGFYSTAAQIIPVLMLVVGFQIRAWEGLGWFRWFALFEFILCVTAINHSLSVLHAEEESWVGPYLEYAAVSILLITIGANLFPWWFTSSAVGHEGDAKPEKRSRKEGRR